MPDQDPTLEVDFSLVHADDAFLDALGAGQVPDDELAAVLAAWRDDVDRAPMPRCVGGA